MTCNKTKTLPIHSFTYSIKDVHRIRQHKTSFADYKIPFTSFYFIIEYILGLWVLINDKSLIFPAYDFPLP